MNKNNITSIVVIVAITLVIAAMIISKNTAAAKISTTELFDLHTNENFNKDEILNKGYPTMLDIGGAECIPCKEMAPTLESVNELLKGKAIIKFVDVNANPNLREQFTFQYIPTQFFYDDKGDLQETHSGVITEAEILSIFKEMGYTF